MSKWFQYSLLLCSFSCFMAVAQNKIPDRLKVFIDCSNTWCDMTFIRTEINLVDFMLDQQAADVHILITEQNTGGGGSQFQFIFFGQNAFNKSGDTIRFNTDPNATDFEIREQFISYLKMGLAPFVAKTKSAKDILIDMKSKDHVLTNNPDSLLAAKKDPWNYWVYRIGVNGSINADEVYKSSAFSGNFSAVRITEELKTGFEINGGKNKSTFEYEDANGIKEKFTNKNNNYSFAHFLVKGINHHWSWGYELIFSRETFSNNKNRSLLRTGIEYNIFPYKEVSTKRFTISYVADIRRNIYIDTTLYDKTKETLLGHSIKTNLSFNQKWGTVTFGTEYHNYFNNWKLLNLKANCEVEIRITGGLSFDIYSSAELIRDQLYLPKEGATPQEVLTRRRQLASGYAFTTNFGINYRFGSKLNNFVNPRFD